MLAYSLLSKCILKSNLTLTRLGVFAKLYEVTKAERNKYLSLIHISNQNLAEMKEKLDNLEENQKNLQLTAINKDKYLSYHVTCLVIFLCTTHYKISGNALQVSFVNIN